MQNNICHKCNAVITPPFGLDMEGLAMCPACLFNGKEDAIIIFNRWAREVMDDELRERLNQRIEVEKAIIRIDHSKERVTNQRNIAIAVTWIVALACYYSLFTPGELLINLVPFLFFVGLAVWITKSFTKSCAEQIAELDEERRDLDDKKDGLRF